MIDLQDTKPLTLVNKNIFSYISDKSLLRTVRKAVIKVAVHTEYELVFLLYTTDLSQVCISLIGSVAEPFKYVNELLLYDLIDKHVSPSTYYALFTTFPQLHTFHNTRLSVASLTKRNYSLAEKLSPHVPMDDAVNYAWLFFNSSYFLLQSATATPFIHFISTLEHKSKHTISEYQPIIDLFLHHGANPSKLLRYNAFDDIYDIQHIFDDVDIPLIKKLQSYFWNNFFEPNPITTYDNDSVVLTLDSFEKCFGITLHRDDELRIFSSRAALILSSCNTIINDSSKYDKDKMRRLFQASPLDAYIFFANVSKIKPDSSLVWLWHTTTPHIKIYVNLDNIKSMELVNYYIINSDSSFNSYDDNKNLHMYRFIFLTGRSGITSLLAISFLPKLLLSSVNISVLKSLLLRGTPLMCQQISSILNMYKERNALLKWYAKIPFILEDQENIVVQLLQDQHYEAAKIYLENCSYLDQFHYFFSSKTLMAGLRQVFMYEPDALSPNTRMTSVSYDTKNISYGGNLLCFNPADYKMVLSAVQFLRIFTAQPVYIIRYLNALKTSSYSLFCEDMVFVIQSMLHKKNNTARERTFIEFFMTDSIFNDVVWLDILNDETSILYQAAKRTYASPPNTTQELSSDQEAIISTQSLFTKVSDTSNLPKPLPVVYKALNNQAPSLSVKVPTTPVKHLITDVTDDTLKALVSILSFDLQFLQHRTNLQLIRLFNFMHQLQFDVTYLHVARNFFVHDGWFLPQEELAEYQVLIEQLTASLSASTSSDIQLVLTNCVRSIYQRLTTYTLSNSIDLYAYRQICFDELITHINVVCGYLETSTDQAATLCLLAELGEYMGLVDMYYNKEHEACCGQLLTYSNLIVLREIRNTVLHETVTWVDHNRQFSTLLSDSLVNRANILMQSVNFTSFIAEKSDKLPSFAKHG